MNVTLSHPTKKFKGTVKLPASKSISNRALILKQVLGSSINLHKHSEADDTVLMQQALAQGNGTIHLKNAGTCMRFLTAYFAATANAEVVLQCDERMKKRPIDELVMSLQQLGADIQYLEQPGFPPLVIKGKKLSGGIVQISATASSQFVSALLMIAPLCKNDLTIELKGAITSKPYMDMTVKLMQQFGISITFENQKFEIRNPTNNIPVTSNNPYPISHTSILNSQFAIEPDWSAAGYWYELVALSENAEITLPHLSPDSLQGDRVIAEYMELFGVQTTEVENGLVIKKSPQFIKKEAHTLDLVNCPDLAPTLAVTAAATNTALSLTGLQNLAIKESNRLAALKTELSKAGFMVNATADALEILPQEHERFLRLSTQLTHHNGSPFPSPITTYNDHRMAMAFAPLSLIFNGISIENPGVVHKSYPHFWDDMQQVGFVLSHTP
jgi:3-phosphoshikimate 1-carboxyvinyltransferase